MSQRCPHHKAVKESTENLARDQQCALLANGARAAPITVRSVLEIIRLGASDWQENAEDRPIRTALPTFFDLRQAIFGTSHQTGATTVWHAACTVHICVVQLYTPRLHIFRQFR